MERSDGLLERPAAGIAFACRQKAQKARLTGLLGLGKSAAMTKAQSSFLVAAAEKSAAANDNHQQNKQDKDKTEASSTATVTETGHFFMHLLVMEYSLSYVGPAGMAWVFAGKTIDHFHSP